MSLCAGVCGLDLGLHIAMPRARTVCYVEREAYAASVIVARMADSTLDEAPVWSELESFDGKPWRGCVDIITSGDPCQPFSVAGKRLGEADERYVWDDVARIIREVEPRFVFLENVAGAIEFRFECRKQLEGMGYRVEAGLFSAKEVGASHQRVRLFLLAHSESRCEPLAHAGGQRHLPRVEGIKEGEGKWWSRLGSDSKGLADSRESGYEERGGSGLPGEEAGRINQGATTDRDCRLPLFPPGPADLEAWREVLERWPEVEPAVCGVADGTTPWLDYRNDQLRCLGNGVVPVVAALAFRTLWGRQHNNADCQRGTAVYRGDGRGVDTVTTTQGEVI